MGELIYKGDWNPDKVINVDWDLTGEATQKKQGGYNWHCSTCGKKFVSQRDALSHARSCEHKQ